MPNYSLHDARITKIKTSDNLLTFLFNDGFYEIEEPHKRVMGSVSFEQVDQNVSSIYILDYNNLLPGDSKNFTGIVYSINDFINLMNQHNYLLDIVDETYGYNRAHYSGFIMDNEKILEFKIEIYHFGQIIYHTWLQDKLRIKHRWTNRRDSIRKKMFTHLIFNIMDKRFLIISTLWGTLEHIINHHKLVTIS